MYCLFGSDPADLIWRQSAQIKRLYQIGVLHFGFPHPTPEIDLSCVTITFALCSLNGYGLKVKDWHPVDQSVGGVAQGL